MKEDVRQSLCKMSDTLPSGELTVITGPMCSGKTTETLRRLFNEASIGMKCLYINHSSDTRSESAYSTHNPLYKEKLSEMSNVTMISTNDIAQVKGILEYDVIAIDELQFFEDSDVYEICCLVEDEKKTVIVSGLNLDFQRNKFETIKLISPYADEFVLLHAYCERCAEKKVRTKAIFSHRVAEGDSQILVGGKKDYIPVCRGCYSLLNVGKSDCSWDFEPEDVDSPRDH